MRKLYYAYVKKDMVDYFEKNLNELGDKIKVLQVNEVKSENGEPLKYYELEAEECIINSKWELKDKRES